MRKSERETEGEKKRKKEIERYRKIDRKKIGKGKREKEIV